MEKHDVLVVCAATDGGSQKIRAEALPAPFNVTYCCAVGEALDYLSHTTPAVVIIETDGCDALAVARSIRRAWPEGHIIFVSFSGNDAALWQQMHRTPMLGRYKLLTSPGDDELRASVMAATQLQQTRTRLRTTLDRANLRLTAGERLDGQRYRKLVISDRFLANVVTHAREAVFFLDLERRVLSWNRGAEHLFGRRADEVIGKDVDNLPGWSASLTEQLDAAARHTSATTRDATLSVIGSEVTVEVTTWAVRDDAEQLLGFTVLMHDVTQRKYMLEAERAARLEAERINRMKDEFLATLSHELRTPLNAVIGWAHILQSGRAKQDDLRAGLDAIHRNARLQAQIIEDLLDVSRIISGKLRLDVQPVSLIEVVEGALSAVAPATEAKGIRIQRVLDPAAGPVSGDPQRLHQVVWNLLTNAAKFTPKGGKIKVQLSNVNSHAEIIVEDTGQGVAPEFLPHIFDRFTQADASTTRRHGGLGLGLSLVKQLVEMHGGTVRAHSAGVGQGATFTVDLPISAVQRSTTPVPRKAATLERLEESEPSSDTSATLSALRILVVDDEADARLVVQRLLSDAGAETAAAPSAEDALRAIPTFKPHVIVSDIGMPYRDGYDLIKEIRQQGVTSRDLPAIALTAFARAEDRKRALMAGYQLHLPKPVDAHELVAAVASIAGMTGTLR